MRSLRFTSLLLTLPMVVLSSRAGHSAPSTPTGFVVAPPTTCGAIRLSWNADPDVIGYRIYRNGVLLGAVRAGQYYDYEMPNPGTYTYAIESFDLTGVSPQVSGNSTLPAPAVSVAPWDWFQDVFPDPVFPDVPGTPGFALTTARVRTGRNNAPLTGDLTRMVDPGRDVLIYAPGAALVQIIYRIKPGPGNYVVPGVPGMGLAVVPGGAPACPGDGSYWGPDIGPPACPGIGVWDPDNWILRACDLLGGGYYLTRTAGVPIFPDNLFTPGTVVQYYFIAYYDGGVPRLLPDPACVMQVATQNSIDGHRWEQFTVLPDLWKDPAYGGAGLPCALVVDLEDGRGNERTWAGMSDSLGGTAPAARGRYNGWSAPGGEQNLDSMAHFVNGPNMAAGTTWDLYNVRGWQSTVTGGAGALGGRLGFTPPMPANPATGPWPDVLDAYYRILILLTGDRSSQILGPYTDYSQDDTEMVRQFAIGATEDSRRGILVVGNGVITSLAADVNAIVLSLLSTSLRSPDLPAVSGTTASCTGLVPWIYGPPVQTISGVRNPPGAANDVLTLEGDGEARWLYDDGSMNPVDAPYFATVFTPAEPSGNPDNHYKALVEGWNIRDLNGPGCVSSPGRLAHYFDVFTNLFGDICSVFGSGSQTIDVPDAGPSRRGTQVLELRNNPVREGSAEIRFALGAADNVRATVSDVAGRILRRIPGRAYAPGEHVLAWDGRDDAGRLLPRGVYHVRVFFERAAYSGARTVVLLK